MENPYKQKSVKVIDHKPHTKRRGELYNVLGKYGIFPTKMHSGQGVFFPIIYESDLENMLKDDLGQFAMEKGFEIKVPIEYSAMKTVVVKEIDSMVDEFQDAEIKESIERLNDWAKVVDIFRFGTTSKMIKIQFSSTAMANKAIKEGIIILNQRIPPRRIEKEIFVKLMPCNNCYNYEHETKNCTGEKQTLCAFCGESGHRQNACENTTPRCINCGEAHRTLAAQCKIRKDLIKKRRKEIRLRSRSRSRSQVRIDTRTTSDMTYLAAAKSGGPSQEQGRAVLSCEPEMKELTTIILTSIVYSQYRELLEPGSFQRNMDDMYKENGLQRVKFPKQTNIAGMKELYKEILKGRLEEEHETSEEVFMESDGEMDTGVATKRLREPSVSPVVETEAKKKKDTKEEEGSSKHSSVKLQPQIRPPLPPPMIQRTQTVRREKKKDPEHRGAEAETDAEIADRIRRERDSSVRTRTSSQSSTTSVGSTGGLKQLTPKDLNIHIFVPKTGQFIRLFDKGLSKQGKEEIIKALFKGQARLRWDHAEVKRESILKGINLRHINPDCMTFNILDMEDYVKIRDGPTQSK